MPRRADGAILLTLKYTDQAEYTHEISMKIPQTVSAYTVEVRNLSLNTTDYVYPPKKLTSDVYVGLFNKDEFIATITHEEIKALFSALFDSNSNIDQKLLSYLEKDQRAALFLNKDYLTPDDLNFSKAYLRARPTLLGLDQKRNKNLENDQNISALTKFGPVFLYLVAYSLLASAATLTTCFVLSMMPSLLFYMALALLPSVILFPALVLYVVSWEARVANYHKEVIKPREQAETELSVFEKNLAEKVSQYELASATQAAAVATTHLSTQPYSNNPSLFLSFVNASSTSNTPTFTGYASSSSVASSSTTAAASSSQNSSDAEQSSSPKP